MLKTLKRYLYRTLTAFSMGWRSGNRTLCLAKAIVTVAISLVAFAQTTHSKTTVELSDKEYHCLFEAVYHEARSEDMQGQIAVATVVLNRVASGKFGGTTVCSVVRHRSVIHRLVCAFSFTCHKLNRIDPKQAAIVYQSIDLVLKGLILRGTDNVLFYHRDDVKPYWSRNQSL